LVAAWLADNSPSVAVRSVVFGLLGITPISQVIAGQVYKAKYAPTFKIPLAISMGITVTAIILFSTVRVLYMIENSKRRKMIAGWTEEEIAEEKANPARIGDRKRTFIRHL
jgi:hypothetical protein